MYPYNNGVEIIKLEPAYWSHAGPKSPTLLSF